LQRHSQDVLQRQQGGKVDLSRVDAMVAVRMRITGHSQAERLFDLDRNQKTPTVLPLHQHGFIQQYAP